MRLVGMVRRASKAANVEVSPTSNIPAMRARRVPGRSIWDWDRRVWRSTERRNACRPRWLSRRPPVTDDIQPTVRGNDRGVGCGYGLGSNEILIDPGKPVAAQRGKLGAYDWLETDVAGVATRRAVAGQTAKLSKSGNQPSRSSMP